MHRYRAPARRRLLPVVASALLLASGLFAAPYVAGLYDFGHQHGDHEPEHVHEIDVTLRTPILTDRVSLALLAPDAGYAPTSPADDARDTRSATGANPIRGPPDR